MDDEYEIERLMTDFEFPTDEVDGDKLEAIKEEKEEATDFKRWFKGKASARFKNMGGMSNFIDFIAQLPVEERNSIRDLLEDRILGNPSLEVMFMLSYGLPFALSEYYEGVSVMSGELRELNDSVSVEALRNVMLLREEQKNYANAVKRATSVAINEISAAGERQVIDIDAQLKKHELSLAAFATKAQADIDALKQRFEQDIANRRLSHDAEIEAEKTKARNTVYKDISSKVESVADKAFKKVHDKYSTRNALYNAGAAMVGMAVFTILSKFFH